MFNALTIDVEDYYMVSAFEDVVRFEDWDSYESCVEKNTYRILELLNQKEIRATFFVLGWVAEKYPNLVKEINDGGHEVACHSYKHRLIYSMNPEEFREDTHKAKAILEDIIGSPVIGYRAPSYSIVKENQWALDILIEEGFLYDSSIFPIHHDRYGIPEAERFKYIIKRNAGSIIEMPMSTLKIFGHNLPVAGGGYFRLFPGWFTSLSIRFINKYEKQPVVFYMHPWEIDANQPRIEGSRLSRFRHYINLKSTFSKLRNLLFLHEFKPLSELIN